MSFVEMAQQIVERYVTRLAVGEAQAKAKLVNEIAFALSDVRANVGITGAVANRLKKKREAEASPAPDPSLTISEKILNGKPLTGAKEDEIIFGGM